MDKHCEIGIWRALAREWRERADRHAAEGLVDFVAYRAVKWYESKIAEAVDEA